MNYYRKLVHPTVVWSSVPLHKVVQLSVDPFAEGQETGGLPYLRGKDFFIQHMLIRCGGRQMAQCMNGYQSQQYSLNSSCVGATVQMLISFPNSVGKNVRLDGFSLFQQGLSIVLLFIVLYCFIKNMVL